MKSKSKLLITSSLLSQVLHPTNVLAYEPPRTDVVGSQGLIATQLREYFANESAEAEQVFETSQYYVDNVVQNGVTVPHVFQLSVAVQKLKVPAVVTNPSENCSSSTGACSPCVGSSSVECPPDNALPTSSFNYQFIFSREDLTQKLLGVWGDGLSCANRNVGSDAKGNPLYAETCVPSSDGTYYGNLVADANGIQIFKIAETNTTDLAIPFTTLTVTKRADGSSAATFLADSSVGEQIPVGTVQSGIILNEKK